MIALAEGRTVSDPQINAILLTRNVNHYLGVQLMPWEIDELPEDLIVTLDQLMNGLPTMRRHLAEVEQELEKFRNSHPTYRAKR